MGIIFAIMVTVFLVPFCVWAVLDFMRDYGNNGFSRSLTLAWCWYALGGAAMILFLVWAAALDPNLNF